MWDYPEQQLSLTTKWPWKHHESKVWPPNSPGSIVKAATKFGYQTVLEALWKQQQCLATKQPWNSVKAAA